MLKFEKVNMVDVGDWDALVEETYGKPYSFQQQDGCKPRGVEHFSVPNHYPWDYENDTLPYKINGEEMGVSFKEWLSTNPTAYKDIFWERNFYLALEILADDLYQRGLIPEGEYTINVDW
jgi:hypothetical protein